MSRREEIRLAVEEMIEKGYIERSIVDGEEHWRLTDKGRNYLAVIALLDEEREE